MKGQAWMVWAHPPEYPPSSGPVSCPSPPPDRDVHRLVFPAVGPQHAGVYKSVIANKLGKAACYAHLYVTGEAGTLRSAGYTVWPLAHLGTWVRAGPLHRLSFSSILWGAAWPCLCPRGFTSSPCPKAWRSRGGCWTLKAPHRCWTCGFQMWFQGPQTAPLR